MPSSGKSSIVKQIVLDKKLASDWKVKKYRKLRFMISQKLKLIVFGVYDSDPKKTFSGTDMLSMDIYSDSTSFLRKLKEQGFTRFNILIEGDRFNNGKFFDHLKRMDYDNSIIVVNISSQQLEKRQFARGNQQSEQFIKRCRTKVSNIIDRYTCNVFDNNDADDFVLIVGELKWMLGVGDENFKPKILIRRNTKQP